MDILKLIAEDGLFTGDYLDKNLIQVCFMQILQVRVNSCVESSVFSMLMIM